MFYNEFEVVNMIPNPNAPDEYKYETDYRKIPRQYQTLTFLKDVAW